MVNYAKIEAEAYALQAAIYRSRDALFPLGVPRPLQMLQPHIAAQVLGVSYQDSADLGGWGNGNDRFEIAGSLDRQRGIITISSRLSFEIARFTAGHELGHVALNHSGHVIHRDRPISQIETYRRPIPEQEADYFSACFYAPGKLVSEAMVARFGGRIPLPMDDDIVFNLCGLSGHAAMRAGHDSWDFAVTVASARRFNGRHFRSLTDEFGLSPSAMAIRLRELDLIDR